MESKSSKNNEDNEPEESLDHSQEVESLRATLTRNEFKIKGQSDKIASLSDELKINMHELDRYQTQSDQQHEEIEKLHLKLEGALRKLEQCKETESKQSKDSSTTIKPKEKQSFVSTGKWSKSNESNGSEYRHKSKKRRTSGFGSSFEYRRQSEKARITRINSSGSATRRREEADTKVEDRNNEMASAVNKQIRMLITRLRDEANKLLSAFPKDDSDEDEGWEKRVGVKRESWIHGQSRKTRRKRTEKRAVTDNSAELECITAPEVLVPQEDKVHL